MSKIIELRGIAWDHPRGYAPLRATSKEFSKIQPNVIISWDVRSLKEFGDMPIEDLIDRYDLITIDHPYMGQAYENKLLLPMEDWLSKATLSKMAGQSVGESFLSYCFKNHQYALPIDAAAQVAVSRTDLVLKLNLTLPKTREELLAFYKAVPNEFSIAWPLCPTDLWCSYLTLCAQDYGRDFIQNNSIETKTGAKVLDQLKRHLEHLHPESINWNPIHILDRMSNEDHIIYSPYLFGYTNYSRAGFAKNILSFSNSPINTNNNVSTILGGVGLAISTKCKHAMQAVEYVKYVASSKIQEGPYTKNEGQPGNLVAWKSKSNNILCNNFFKNTIKTMENAYVRPQHPGWNQFQEKGADLLHNGIIKDIPSDKLMKKLNELYKSIVNYE